MKKISIAYKRGGPIFTFVWKVDVKPLPEGGPGWEDLSFYETEDGTRIAARPSGTEPKVKFYISTNTKLDKAENYKKVSAELDAKIKNILAELKLG